jgi:hypothetical protein
MDCPEYVRTGVIAMEWERDSPPLACGRSDQHDQEAGGCEWGVNPLFSGRVFVSLAIRLPRHF